MKWSLENYTLPFSVFLWFRTVHWWYSWRFHLRDNLFSIPYFNVFVCVCLSFFILVTSCGMFVNMDHLNSLGKCWESKFQKKKNARASTPRMGLKARHLLFYKVECSTVVSKYLWKLIVLISAILKTSYYIIIIN